MIKSVGLATIFNPYHYTNKFYQAAYIGLVSALEGVHKDMKRLSVAIIALLMVSTVVLPVPAQKLSVLNTDNNLQKHPVRYADVAAFSEGSGVWLEWKTVIESKNLGFYVYRVTNGERELVSPRFLAGAYMQARDEKITSGSYTFFDKFGGADSIYVIESVNLSGQKHYSNLIKTSLVNDLTPFAGVSSAQLMAQAENAALDTVRSNSILPPDLEAEVDANTLESNAVNQLWVAGQPGVKLGVKTEGLYRVTKASLQAGGFNVNAPSNLWQLYLNGVEQSIIVGDNGEYIEFYGRGIETLESQTQIYYLVVGSQNGKRMGTTTRRRIGSNSVVSESYSQSFTKREQLTYSSNVFNGDLENFFGTLIFNAGGTVNFELSGIDFTSTQSSMEINLQGHGIIPHQTRVKLNGVELGTMNGTGFNAYSKTFEIATSLLQEGANSLQFIPLNGAQDIALFSSLKLDFTRRYQAEQNRISFYVPNFKASYIENFSSSNIRVFDTTNAAAPLQITGLPVEQNNGSFRVQLPANRGRVMFAVEDASVLQPASIVANIPSTLSTAAHQADLVIISHKNFLTEATAWADYRRAQGMKVEVVEIQDIFDEFNYGVVKSDSIRTFLQYAKSNWQIAPNYVLLIGDATYDPKNYFGLDANYVPTRLVDTVYSETGSDETLADFNNDGLAELAVGRIPARDGATVTLVFNKLRVFEQTVGTGLSRGAVFAYDVPDGNDFQGMSIRLSNQLPSSVPRLLIGRDMPNAQTQLITALNNSPFIVNYSGHGNVGVWAANSFFSSTSAGQLTNTNLSVYTLLSCLNGYFINPTDSLAEHLLKNPNGGAASVWASTGLTLSSEQEVMATRFYNQIAAGNITRIGDLIKDAKTTLTFGPDVRLSWALLGDPTMKIK